MAVFAAVGLLGLRFPALLVLGYALHGGWDLAHEILVHLGAGGSQPLTASTSFRLWLQSDTFSFSLELYHLEAL